MKDLKKFADDAVDGLIVFTLGSAIPVASMPENAVEAFLKAFARLPQRVIWKWEKTNMEAPPNVLLIDWLPQQDILGKFVVSWATSCQVPLLFRFSLNCVKNNNIFTYLLTKVPIPRFTRKNPQTPSKKIRKNPKKIRKKSEKNPKKSQELF